VSTETTTMHYSLFTRSSSLKFGATLTFLLVNVLILFESYKCDQWEYDLVHNLFKGYDNSIRPSIRHNMSINVTFGLALAQLIDVVNKLNLKSFTILFINFIL
jgi:hypothetical protein